MTTESAKPDTPPTAPPATPTETADAVVTDASAVTENVTPAGKKDGLITCVSCGASEVTYNPAKGMFRCAFCRHEWAEVKLDEAMGLSHGIGELKGTTLSSNAMDIASDEALVTMKCTGCGAEVVVNTDNTYDLAVQGQGFFKIDMPTGQEAYTRAGSFQLSPTGQLVTNNGFTVQPGITIPREAVGVTINSNGEVEVKLDGQVESQIVGQRTLDGVVHFVANHPGVTARAGGDKVGATTGKVGMLAARG